MSGLPEWIQALLPALGLASIRVGAAFVAMPAPFGSVAPMRTRALLSMLVALALLPLYADRVADLDLEPVALVRAGMGELMLGAVIGLTVRMTLVVAEIAGSIAGFSMGLGFATSVDPAFGEGALPTTRAIGAFGTLLFFAFDGHHAVLAAFASTLSAAPPGDAWSAVAHEGLLSIGSRIFTHGLQIAAPVVATMFIVQLATALVARAAPRVNLFAFSFAMAAGAGVLTMVVAAPSIATAIAVEVRRLPAALAEVLMGV
ncbi:MAG: flagellar biosynthetic protein FliR [Myxococcales bacterium]|nr:flagellar biosynthetic protein FliR [Myxococcales bacterium]